MNKLSNKGNKYKCFMGQIWSGLGEVTHPHDRRAALLSSIAVQEC